ncbi:MAG: nitrilase-related carbon-nitrogen hydrolase, partial [Leptolyngbyaceae bacterium]|nr:nitrilase-related carbon-nitrogen hydrolase [Leptolyngbyaceae bacterium]
MEYNQKGILRVAAISPTICLADPTSNTLHICKSIREAYDAGASIIALPELCITGYSCGDLFHQALLIESANEELIKIAEASKNINAAIVVGLPVRFRGRLYNCAAVLCKGSI